MQSPTWYPKSEIILDYDALPTPDHAKSIFPSNSVSTPRSVSSKPAQKPIIPQYLHDVSSMIRQYIRHTTTEVRMLLGTITILVILVILLFFVDYDETIGETNGHVKFCSASTLDLDLFIFILSHVQRQLHRSIMFIIIPFKLFMMS